ncbi:MAG: ELWxxDGT repeat protein [Limnospira sp.]
MKIDSPNPTLCSELVIIDPKVSDWETLAAGVIPGIRAIVLDPNRDGITQITEILQQAERPVTTLHIISHGSPGCLYIGNTQLSLDTLNRYTPQLQTWFAPPAPQVWGEKASPASKLQSPPELGDLGGRGEKAPPASSLQSPPFLKAPNVGGLGAEDLGGQSRLFSPLPKGGQGGSLLLYGCNVAAGDAGEEFIRKLHNLTRANIAATQTPTGNATWELNYTLGPIEPKLALNAETQATYAGVLGVKLVKDINPGSGSSLPNSFAASENKLFFQADDGSTGEELWVSDGTEAGTQLLKDINPGSLSSSPEPLSVVGNKLFFNAYDGGGTGRELWVTDGTEVGTQLVKDIEPGGDSSFDSIYDVSLVLGNKLFFTVNNTRDLWVTDGTELGTQLVKRAGLYEYGRDINDLTVLGDKLFFSAYNRSILIDELWVTDGTEAGTQLVKDITPGIYSSDFDSDLMAVLGNRLFFIVEDGDDNRELWVTDGTEVGTRLVIDVNPNQSVHLVDEKLFFSGHREDIDGNDYGFELWMYVNEAPTALSFDSNSVDENAATGTVVGNLTSTDPDSFDIHTYTLLNDAGGRFAVSGDQIVVADGTLIDRETIDSHSIRVQTTDPGGLSYERNFIINVNNINEAPEISDQSFEIAEDATDGTPVGTVTSSDVDGPTLTYSITAGNDDSIFAINGITGEITIVDSTQLDFETTDSYNLTVQVTDTEHQTDATVTVSITDANDAPEIGDQSLSVAEDAIDGTSVGTPTASDPDGDSLTYSITAGNGDGIFTIDESTGEITVADSTQLNFETAESYNLTVQIDDGEYQTSAAVTVNLTDVNETPEFTSTAPTSATQGITYTYNIVIDDPDAGDTLAITAPTLPDWLTLTDNGDGTATLTGTPDNDQVGDHTVELQVEDAGGEIQTQSVTVTVSNVNDAPTISGTPDTTVDEDSGYSFTPTAEDIDAGDTLNFSIQNKPGWATFDSATGKLGGTPTNEDVGTTENIVISVSDGTEAVTLDGFSLEVVNANDAPEFASTAPTSGTQGSAYTYNIVIDDPDAGDTLAITAPTLPDWLTLTDNGDGTATLTGTPDNDQVGDHTVEVQVEDEAGEIRTQNFTLRVKNTNDAPTLSGTPDTTVEEEATYSFVPTAEDLDGDTLSFSIQNKPSWATFNSTTGKLSGTPTNEDVGTTENIVISASDGTETTTLNAFSLEVVNINDAPEITSTAPTSIAQDATYTYNLLARDTDAGDTLTITAPTLPDWLTLTDNGDGTATLSGTPDNDQVGDHTVELQVEDEAGEIQTQSFTLAVSNVNDAPTISGTPDTSVDEDSSYSFTPTAEDLDGDTLSFSIQNKPSWATFNSATGKLSGTPRNKDVGKTENIVISVTDGTKTVALDAFGLEVINTNDVPQIGDQKFSIAEDAPRGITVGTVVASDADGDSLIYSITKGNEDGVFAIDENTGEITVFDDSKLDFEAVPSYRLTIEVSDQETGESATVTVGITNVNEAPETINLSSLSIAENSLGNTIVGTLSTADPDASDLHTYTLIDDADGRFKLSGNILAVNQGDKLDYETDTSHTITVKTTDKRGLSYEQELAIAVEDGIINSESELEKYLGDRRISGLPKGAIDSMFDLFEIGEENPESTPTAAIEFEKVSTVGGDKQQQISLTSLNDYPISLTPLLDVLSQVPSYSFSAVTSLLDDLGVSIALTEPTLTISNLDTVAVYEISTEVEIPDGEENFLGFIKDLLRVDELVLKAGINSDNYHPYVGASLDIDDITLFEIDDFSLEISGADLVMETDLKGEPSVGITPKLKLTNYDPIQSDEPPLELQGLFTFEPESITAGFMLAPEETWKNPFGLPDTEIRNVAFELGVTYAGTGFDNFNLIGDVKFGNFDIASAFAIDVNDPNKNGIVLTVNQPVNLLDLWMGPIASYVLDTIHEPIKPIQSTLEFLRQIVDINIESIDTDNDGDLDPLIKVLPEPKSIAGTTMQTGLSVNGKLTAWGAEATLKIEGNPYNPGNLFQGELLVDPIDLGFVEILGADDPNLSLNIGINLDEQYLRGDARLKMFGQTVAKADVEVTLSGFTIKDFDVDLGLVGFDVDDLSINWSDKTAKGRGEVTVLGQSIGLLDFATDSDSITINDFDVDLGLVALDVDDFSVNWKNQTARGKGEVEVLGQSIGRLDFVADSDSLTIKDFYRDFGLVALDVDDLSVNWENNTAGGKGEVEVLGYSVGRLDFVADSDSITFKNFDVDFGLVALDVDDLSVNWEKNTAAGSGELEILGQTIADADFSMTSSSLTINDFDVDFGLVALDVDDLSVNWENNTAAGSGELEILGQTIADADFSMTSSSLTINDFDVDFGLVALDVDDLSVNWENNTAAGSGELEILGQKDG